MNCPLSYPVYLIKRNSGKWEVITSPLNKDIKHTTLWELIVARIVAKDNDLEYADIKNLPYCQKRARVVKVIDGYCGKIKVYCGEKLTKEQMFVMKKSIGECVYIHDEHECTSQYDVEVFNNLIGIKNA